MSCSSCALSPGTIVDSARFSTTSVVGPLAKQLGAAGPHLLHQLEQVDGVARRVEPLRLDPRQRHQILDELLHPLALAVHQAEEADPDLGILAPVSSSWRVSMKPSTVASGVRSSWLALATKSTRIRSAAIASLRSCEVDEPGAVRQRRDRHQPPPLGLADSDDLDLLDAARPAAAGGTAARRSPGGAWPA